ncbi:MAG TPA: hypothetical protein VNO14_12295 [Blastocatellia bacterium]|nr:hypothetical protein [Blastocatellia bacterium]
MKLPVLFARKKKSNHTAWKVIGGTALALVAAGLIVNLPDIKKYIKISTM